MAMMGFCGLNCGACSNSLERKASSRTAIGLPDR